LRLIASLPKGKKENWPITKLAFAQGMPTMVSSATKPTSHQASPITKPPRMNQRKLPIARIARLVEDESREFSGSAVHLGTFLADCRGRPAEMDENGASPTLDPPKPWTADPAAAHAASLRQSARWKSRRAWRASHLDTAELRCTVFGCPERPACCSGLQAFRRNVRRITRASAYAGWPISKR
jgi:hypothetical protein